MNPNQLLMSNRCCFVQWFVAVNVLVYEVVQAEFELQRVVNNARSLIASPYWPEVVLSVREPGFQVCNPHGSM